MRIEAQPNTVSSRVIFKQKRDIYFEPGEYPNNPALAGANGAPFIFDSDSVADAHELAKLYITSTATQSNQRTSVFATLASLEPSSMGGYVRYQPKDITWKNIKVYGNGKVELFPASPTDLYNGSIHGTGVYNGTGAAFNMGNGIRIKLIGCTAMYVQGYLAQMGLDATPGTENGQPIGGLIASEQLVKDCRIYGAMSQMIALNAIKDSIVEDNHFLEIAPYLNSNITVIDFEPNNQHAQMKNLIIRRNFLRYAVAGEKNSFTGAAHPAQSAQVGVDGGGNAVHKSRFFFGIVAQRAGASVGDRIAVIENTIRGEGGCLMGLEMRDLTNSYVENNKVSDCLQAYSQVRANTNLKHRGNVFEGAMPSTGIVWIQSCKDSTFEGDSFDHTNGGPNGNDKYLEQDLTWTSGTSNGQPLGVTVSATGLLTVGIGVDRSIYPHMKDWEFVVNGTVIKITNVLSVNSAQTNYSGAAITNQTGVWKVNSSTFDSKKLSKATLAAGSKSQLFQPMEITPGLPKGTNVASAFVVTASSIEGGEGNAGRAPSHVNDGIINPAVGMWASSPAPSVEAPQTLTFTAQSPQEIKLIRVWGTGDGYPTNPNPSDVANNQRIKNYSIWALINSVLTEVATVTNNTLVASESSVNLYTTKLEFRFTEVAGGPVRVTEIQLFDKTGTY